LSSSPRPPSNLQVSLVILATKNVSTLQSSILRNNNQNSEDTLRDRRNVRFQKVVARNVCEEAF